MQHWIGNIAELISFIIAIIYYPYLKRGAMKWVLPFLGFIFFMETIGGLMSNYFGYSHNQIVYFIVGAVEVIFYGNFFYKYCSSIQFKRLIKFISISLTFGYIIGFIFRGKSDDLLFFLFLISDLFYIINSLQFLYTNANDENLKSLHNAPGFWVAFGLSFFSAGNFVLYLMHNILTQANLYILDMPIRLFIIRLLCIVLYACISIAIIKTRKAVTI